MDDGIRNGESFARVITEQLHDAHLVVALLTPQALRKPSVVAEMAVARLARAAGLAEGHKLRVLAVPAA